MKSLLSPDGVFVFAVDTIANRCIDDTEYIPSVTVPFEDGTALTLKTKTITKRKVRHSFLRASMSYAGTMNCCHKNLWIFRHISIPLGKWKDT